MIFFTIFLSPMTGMMLTFVHRRRMNSRSRALEMFNQSKEEESEDKKKTNKYLIEEEGRWRQNEKKRNEQTNRQHMNTRSRLKSLENFKRRKEKTEFDQIIAIDSLYLSPCPSNFQSQVFLKKNNFCFWFPTFNRCPDGAMK